MSTFHSFYMVAEPVNSVCWACRKMSSPFPVYAKCVQPCRNHKKTFRGCDIHVRLILRPTLDACDMHMLLKSNGSSIEQLCLLYNSGQAPRVKRVRLIYDDHAQDQAFLSLILIWPSKINQVFLVRAFSKFGEGCPYYLLFFTNLLFISA